jgi:hypothetical protein
MPMSNEDGSVWITYNGEIDNTQKCVQSWKAWVTTPSVWRAAVQTFDSIGHIADRADAHNTQHASLPSLTGSAALNCVLTPSASRGGKQGFTFPFAHWLRREIAEEAQALLAEVIQRGWLQAGPARQTLAAFQTGRLHGSRPWALLALASLRLTVFV